MSENLLFWNHFVVVALFALGVVGVLIRRNAIVVLMCLELMLNSVNLLLVETAVRTKTPDGFILVIFVITIAAAEVAIGLGIILNLYRLRNTIEVDSFRGLQG